MTFVENVKHSWKWFSVQAMTIAGALQGAWMYIPADMKTTVPDNIVHWMTLALLVAGVAGRLIKQPTKA